VFVFVIEWLTVSDDLYLLYCIISTINLELPVLLFCVYIDELLSNLRDKGDGCWLGKLFVGAITYAVRVMLSECDQFGSQYSVRFNATKSKSMLFVAKGRDNKRQTSRPDFYLMGKVYNI